MASSRKKIIPRVGPQSSSARGLWARRFGADPQLAGRVLLLDSQPYAVVGVLPKEFDLPFPEIDVWVTRPSHTSQMPARFWQFVMTQDVIARLKPGTTLAQAQSEMDSLNQGYVSQYPKNMDAKPGVTVRVQPLKTRVVADVRPVLWILFGAVCVLLLIACTNVSGLVLTRASARSHEFATLAALGGRHLQAGVPALCRERHGRGVGQRPGNHPGSRCDSYSAAFAHTSPAPF